MGRPKDYRILPQVFGLGGARGLGLLAGLVLVSLASRNLDEAGFGRLLTHLASLGFGGMLASTGLMTDWLRRAGHGCPASAFAALGRRAALRAGLGLGLYLLLLATVRPSLSLGFVLAGGWILALPMGLAAGPRLLRGDSRALAGAQALGRGLTLVLALGLHGMAVPDPGLWLLAHALGLGLQEGLLFARLPREWKKAYLARPPSPLGAGELWVSAGDLVRSAYHQGAQLLASASMGVPYPLFGAPHRLYGQAGLLPSTLATISQGPFSARRGEAARARLRALLPPMLLLGLLAAAALALPAPLWIALLFPGLSDPARAAAVLRVLALALPASYLSGLLLPYLLARGRDKGVLWVSLLGLGSLLGGFAFAGASPEGFAWIIPVTEGAVLLGAAWLYARGSS